MIGSLYTKKREVLTNERTILIYDNAKLKFDRGNKVIYTTKWNHPLRTYTSNVVTHRFIEETLVVRNGLIESDTIKLLGIKSQP